MIGLKRVAGIWLPLWEERLVPALESGAAKARSRFTLERALRHRSARRRAMDVGAHIGLQSMQLVRRFESVIAFEPLAIHGACFRRNVASRRATLMPCALGAEQAEVGVQTGADSSAETRIAGPGPLPMRRLDDLGLDAAPVDLLALDCEGYELFVLQGAEALLRAQRPTVIVEQRPGAARCHGLIERDAVDYLKGLGAALREEIDSTIVLDWAGGGAP